MPTVAETQLAAVASWFAASSKATTSPLGDPIIRGPFATLVPVGIDDAGANLEALVAPGTLPIFAPQAVSTGIDLTPPQNQAALSDRALHLIWKAQQAPYAPDIGFPAVVVVGLATPLTTIRQALTAAGLGSLDLAARAVLAVRLRCLYMQPGSPRTAGALRLAGRGRELPAQAKAGRGDDTFPPPWGGAGATK